MKYFFLIFIFLGLINNSYSQSNDLQMANKYSDSNLSKYYYSGSVYPTWCKNGIIYRHKAKDCVSYYYIKYKKGKKQKLFNINELSEKISAITKENYDLKDFRVSSLKFDKDNDNVIVFSKSQKNFKYNIKSKKLTEYKKESKRKKYFSKHPFWQKFSPDSSCYVYAYKHNLFLVNKNDTIAHQLTNDGEIYHSYSSKRNKNYDKKTFPSIFWINNSNVFYTLRRDSRKVGDMWVINHLRKPRPTLRTYKFPMPGEKHVFNYDLHLFNSKTLKHTVVDIAKYPDQEVKILKFDKNKNSKYIYFTRKNRTCDKFDLCKVDIYTGKVSEIISEESKPYWMDQLFNYHVLNNGEDIIWWSERTGYGQYYLYNNNGKLKNIITKGDFVAGKIFSIDTLNRSFIFEGYGKEPNIDPNYRFYYQVNFDGTNMHLITPGNGTHSITTSPDKKYFVDIYSRVDNPPVSVLRKINGKKICELEKSDISQLLNIGWKMPKKIKLKATDGVTDLYGVMYSPFDLDTTKKYPIISNVYPGPQEDFVPTSFSLDDNSNSSLAQLGFIVINVGHRGSSPFRKKSYHNFGYGNFRDYALADDKFIIEQLTDSFKYIDINKVGIYGHSGGGFMSTAAILTYPDFYKVAVAASGNHDNSIYTKWWVETHSGVDMKTNINDNDTSYVFSTKIQTNMELAKNLKGKLLLISGDVDPNVHMANTLRMAQALIENNKRFDLFIMPGKDHGLGSKYYINLIRRYFLENLKNKSSNSSIEMIEK